LTFLRNIQLGVERQGEKKNLKRCVLNSVRKEVGLQTQNKFVDIEIASIASDDEIGILLRFPGTTNVSIES
jgi:hypothetical protein